MHFLFAEGPKLSKKEQRKMKKKQAYLSEMEQESREGGQFSVSQAEVSGKQGAIWDNQQDIKVSLRDRDRLLSPARFPVLAIQQTL